MWSIFFALPNIRVQDPVGNDWLAIVPHDDNRIKKAVATGPYTKALVKKFKDQFGRKTYPSFLIFADNIPDRLRNIEALVGFRNSFALSVIIKGHEHSLTSTFVAYPLYSDYFDFYPITVTKDNDGFVTSSPSVLGYDDEHEKFAGQTSPSLAGMSSVSVGLDDRLLKELLRIWERRFLKGRTGEWSTRSLFRSLEMAYRASAMPFQNHASIYDYGSSASLWVSAFEILSHPRTSNANLLTVIDLLGKYNCNEKLIKRNNYKIRHRGNEYRINLPQKLYKELYDTRNSFLHGNPVKQSRLYPFKNTKSTSITRFAPVIYKVALLAFLDKFKSKPRSRKAKLEELTTKIFSERDLSEALLKTKKNN